MARKFTVDGVDFVEISVQSGDSVKKVTAKQARIDQLVEFVKNFQAAEDRGCPKAVLNWVQGIKFTDAEILVARSMDLIEAGRGKEGGYYLFGTAPEKDENSGAPSIVGQMRSFLDTLVSGYGSPGFTVNIDEAKRLVSAHQLSLENRKAGQQKRRANE